jgi:hypothetical protein
MLAFQLADQIMAPFFMNCQIKIENWHVPSREGSAKNRARPGIVQVKICIAPVQTKICTARPRYKQQNVPQYKQKCTTVRTKSVPRAWRYKQICTPEQTQAAKCVPCQIL